MGTLHDVMRRSSTLGFGGGFATLPRVSRSLAVSLFIGETLRER